MNRITLIGNLTNNPDVAATPSGISRSKFSIAVNRRYSKDGEKTVDFFNIVAWRGLADNCNKYLQKGKKVAVVGELQTDKYTDKNGIERVQYQIVADEVEFLSPNERTAQASGDSENPNSSADTFTDVSDSGDTLPF